MLTINTNLSSLIAQRSLTTSTNKLNQAIERMTTGFKINHAKDNAANYSITTDMSTKISAYEVAEENTSMGLDMLATATDSLTQIEDKLTRLRALQEQASNGTYGEQSLKAINAEVNALVDEIERLYSTTSYNGIDLFKGEDNLPAGMPKADPTTGFIAEVVEDTPDVIVSDPTQLATAIANNTKIGIANAETLAELATITNGGNNCSGKTFILTNDIDLADWCEAHKDTGGWVPIGKDYSNTFNGTFNGNAHTISNLYINRPTEDYQGLFGCTEWTGEIKNVILRNVDIVANVFVGALVAFLDGPVVLNSSVTGKIKGVDTVGALIGLVYSNVENCYADAKVTGVRMVGGLIGDADAPILNCYSISDVNGDESLGGLVGRSIYELKNSYSLASISGNHSVGVLAGELAFDVSNCYYYSSINPGLSAVGLGDSTGITDLITPVLNVDIGLQVGIQANEHSRIGIETSILLNNVSDFRKIGLDKNTDFLTKLDELLATVTNKQTEYGSAQNRLMSALEEITVQRDNLISSRSTLRDADIAEVSSSYIQQQILQQASATLLATANQSPSIALGLI